jgi:hypothetical protein
MTREAKRGEWGEQIAARERSGESRLKWCTEHGVNYRSYLQWEKKLHETRTDESTTGRFIRLSPFTSEEHSVCTVFLDRGKVSIEVKGTVDPQRVAALVEALRRIC